HGVGGEVIERTVGIKNLLRIGVEVPNLHRKVDASAKSLSAEQGHDWLDRKGSKNGGAMGSQRQLAAQPLEARTDECRGCQIALVSPKLANACCRRFRRSRF